MEFNGAMIPLEIKDGTTSVGSTGVNMSPETREDLEKELQDPEFASYFGADQAKTQLAFTLVNTRNELNLTQKEVADKLKVSQPYVAKLERGDANPTIGRVGSMLAQLGLRLRTRTEPLLPKPEMTTILFAANFKLDYAITAAETGVRVSFGEAHNLSPTDPYDTRLGFGAASVSVVPGGFLTSDEEIYFPSLVGGAV
jgi:transcriptional regulator with XRE-family HTH domain